MAASVTPRAYIADRAIAFLPPGSEIRQVFVSQTAPHFAYFLPAYLFGVFYKVRFRCVAVTDDGIYVMEGTRMSGGARPIRLLGVMPRSTRFEPAPGLFWHKVTLLGQRCWVHPPYLVQVLAADREAPGAVSGDVG
ncbi:hypothetical protein KHQ06_25345 [Nocardia tengchongensis]|uniref:Uncharacterized protein n=1 Tax=Nocardia tengchongensis TaxID=2055889 RepID=A0ABX8CI74_9NOCA|nr:hypothetical protein [Nocardia tengchongensis]QVI19668.1 hypothetical protein KHQ06_25345 [Nocardia tengchongensis]